MKPLMACHAGPWSGLRSRRGGRSWKGHGVSGGCELQAWLAVEDEPRPGDVALVLPRLPDCLPGL